MRGTVAKSLRKAVEEFYEAVGADHIPREARYAYIDPHKGAKSPQRDAFPKETTRVLTDCFRAEYKFLKRVWKSQK